MMGREIHYERLGHDLGVLDAILLVVVVDEVKQISPSNLVLSATIMIKKYYNDGNLIDNGFQISKR